MNHSFNKTARVIIAECNGQLCGFCAALPFPHPKLKNVYKGHRTIILPDFQGVGIGNALSTFIAESYIMQGKKYISTTSNPAMIAARKKSSLWKCTRIGRTEPNTKGVLKGTTSCSRITASFEYIGIKK